jgi:NTE family protein
MSYRLRPEEISQTSDERKRRPIENVLVMQGGGSLGAFGCGVYKALVKRK